MHNTLTVDGKLFTICKDSWECSKLSQPVKQQFVTGEKYEFVQGGHLGYMDSGVFVNRKIVYIKPDVYILMDECYAQDAHLYEAYYHFNNEGKLDLNGSGAKYTGNACEADFYFLSPDVSLEKLNTHISRLYNHEEDNETIKASWNGNGFSSCVTVIHTKSAGADAPFSCEKIPVKSALKQIEYPASMAEAIKLTIGETEYVVIICHQEVNSPTDLVEADSCLGFGNVIVFDKSEETEVGHTLVW